MEGTFIFGTLGTLIDGKLGFIGNWPLLSEKMPRRPRVKRVSVLILRRTE